MIIPYGHAGLRIYGLPWVTIAIFVLCVLVHGLTLGPSNDAAAETAALFQEIVETYAANPRLELDPDFLDFYLEQQRIDENEREVFLEALAEHAATAPQTGTATQVELDELTSAFWDAFRSSPSYRFGLVPNSMHPLNLITYQFMHGGWGHLFSNLLILYLAAPYIEQRWGRAVFLGFYLTAGVVSALFWAFRYPELDVPLVGASGSIAGLMGAFLLCFGSSKIRFLYIGGTFEAPAWLMLPIWLALEVVSGRATDVSGGGGVAHWAHVWGFIFGMVFAWGLSLVGIDQRLAARHQTASAPEPQARRTRAPRSTPLATPRATPAVEPVNLPPAEIPAVQAESPTDPAPVEPSTAPMRETVIEAVPAIELRPAERLKILEGVPSAIDSAILHFESGGSRRRLDLTKVDAVAVGAIAQSGGRPYVVVDLVLDPPWVGDADLRVLRLRSSTFDPRTLVGGDQPMEAFVQLLERLLDLSSAMPLPDPDRIQSPGSQTYASLEAYQGEVLGIL